MVLLEVNDLRAGYGKRIVIDGVSLGIDKGEIVSILGHNGAGKTTTLASVFGILPPLSGSVVFNGTVITQRSPRDNVKDGISFIPQERFTFPGLTVRENLELGAYTVRVADIPSRLKDIYGVFPILEERQGQNSSTLSGGERRMLGIGMALITNPQLLFLDEPSLGLSPHLVGVLMDTLLQIRQSLGTAILLVEQNIPQALRVSDRVYVMKTGHMILEETAAAFNNRENWADLF